MSMNNIKRRSLLRHSLILGASCALGQSLNVCASSATDQILDMVHPELRAMARQLLTGGIAVAPMSADILMQSRAVMSAVRRAPLEGVSVVRRHAAGGRNQPDVEVFIINSDPGKSRPAILHMHGGGFVLGSAQDAIADLQVISQDLDCVIVTVEYRLAPESSYQDSIEDNYVALKWLYDNAESLGVDPARIAVMGESAGGGHAALLSTVARDRGEVPIAFQCLVYPMLDDRTGTARAVPAHIGKILWTAESNRFGWSSFLGVPAGGAKVPERAVPARMSDVKGLPPAFIGVGSLDLFSEECIEYAQRLNQAGVMTELHVIPGAFHGFDALQNFGLNTRIGERFKNAKLESLRRGLGIAAKESCPA